MFFAYAEFADVVCTIHFIALDLIIRIAGEEYLCIVELFIMQFSLSFNHYLFRHFKFIGIQF
jgi:hypothetical protein